MKLYADVFFSGYRNAFGKLNQEQVDGLNAILSFIEKDKAWESVPQLSYFMATIAHETAWTFQPIKERRGRIGSAIRKIQDRYWGTGYFGRGYIQLTWRKNYEKFGIADDPDKALEPETAYRIAADGMRKGMFTGKSLDDYINDSETDFKNARRIVNGLDRADDIAAIAVKFRKILNAWVVQVTSEPPPVDATPSTSVVGTKDDGGAVKTQDVAPPAQVNVEHAENVNATPAPLPGATKDDPATQIEKVTPSLPNRIAAGAAAAVTPLTALGLKIGSVEVSQSVLIALCLLAAVGIVTGAWVWNKSAERAHEATKRNQDIIADPSKQNVVVK